MARARSVEAKLARLKQLKGDPTSPEAMSELRDALADSSNLVAAAAAAVVGQAKLVALVPNLVAAFDRFLVNPLKSDRTCAAKIALVEALHEVEYEESEVFLQGVRYVQPEPVWGGQQDTAGPLRLASAAALVRLNHPQALPVLVDLLADPERPVRVGAASILAATEASAAGLLLRLKARLGDPEPEVTGECLAGLIGLAPEEAIPFVGEFLHAKNQAVVESALLALGDSRRPAAFAVLKGFWEGELPEKLREPTLLALALLRLPAATDFLLALVAEAPLSEAAPALAALAVQKYDARVRERAQAVVAERGNAALGKVLAEKFRDKEEPRRPYEQGRLG